MWEEPAATRFLQQAAMRDPAHGIGLSERPSGRPIPKRHRRAWDHNLYGYKMPLGVVQPLMPAGEITGTVGKPPVS